MNKPELSIILSSIRKDNLVRLYNSILGSTKRTFELIVVGPYDLPQELKELPNVKYVKDYGSPTRCYQIGALLIEGKIVHHTADDAVYFPNALDESIDLLYSMGDNYKNVVVHKYFEGVPGTQKVNHGDIYYKINGAPCTQSPYIPNDWWIFNSFLMHEQFFFELGGFDCKFSHCMAHTDLAIRAQFLGAVVKMAEGHLTDLDHQQSDHRPIEVMQVQHDEPLFQSIYRNPGWINQEMQIDINNWKNSDSVWVRFKK